MAAGHLLAGTMKRTGIGARSASVSTTAARPCVVSDGG